MEYNNLHKIKTSAGEVDAIVYDAGKSAPVLVAAHGAGVPMTHSFMEMWASDLRALHVSTVRFNFPYMQNQRGYPDPMPVLTETFVAAIELARVSLPNAPLFLGGKSMGSRASVYAANISPHRSLGLVFAGFPLIKPGSDSIERADPLFSVECPMLFLHGTRDTFATVEEISRLTGSLGAKAKLEIFEGAEHSFIVKNRAQKKATYADISTPTASWIQSLL